MKMTNNYNLDETIVQAIIKDDYDYSADEHNVSATSLINPAKQFYLTKRHSDEIVEDVLFANACFQSGKGPGYLEVVV